MQQTQEIYITMAVEQAMKLINMMRSKGWISVDDNEIWREVGADLSFSGPMRKHTACPTRILAGNAVSAAPSNRHPTRHASATTRAPATLVDERTAYIAEMIPPNWKPSHTFKTREYAEEMQGLRWDTAQREGVPTNKLVYDNSVIGPPFWRQVCPINRKN